jgi:CRP-like cAMP-binding protein
MSKKMPQSLRNTQMTSNHILPSAFPTRQQHLQRNASSKPRGLAPATSTLATFGLFQDLPSDVIADLSNHCKWYNYQTNQTIVSCDDTNRDVFFIIHGKVRAIFYAINGRPVSFRNLSAGEMFGELSAIDEKPRSADVVALCDSVVAAIPAKLFSEVIFEYRSFNAALLRRLVHLVRSLSERLVEISASSASYRIRAEMLRLARESASEGGRAVIMPAPTHADIASQVGSQRETVTRELRPDVDYL